jgi:hypothetical protein
MVYVHNNFDGGPNGTTITVANSGQVPGNNPFDLAGSSAQAANQYAGATTISVRPTAEFVCGMQTGTGGSTKPLNAWTTTVGSLTEVWTRFYFLATQVYSTNSVDLNLFAIANASNAGSGVWLQTSQSPFVLMIKESTGSVNDVAMSTVIIPNVWNRIEYHTIMGAGTGSSDLFLYMNPNADIDLPYYNETISQTSASYGSPPATQYILGQGWGQQLSMPPFYYSNWAISDGGYIGPAPFRQGLGSPMGNLPNPIAIHTDVN